MTGRTNSVRAINNYDDKTTPNYIADGLVALYDGIKNTRSGHTSLSGVWEDLSGNNIDLLSENNPNYQVFLIDSAHFYQNAMSYASAIPNIITVEFVLLPEVFGGSANWIMQLNGTNTKNVCISRAKTDIQFGNGRGFPISPNKISAISYDFANDECVIDGIKVQHNSYSDSWSRTPTSGIQLSMKDNYPLIGSLYSLRLYSRTLTAEEKAHNYAIDIKRFNIPNE
jgi:hypothetical protein